MANPAIRGRSPSVAWVVVSLLALGACERKEPIRIGLNTWPGFEFLYLAEHKGFFAAEGVKVRLVELGSLDDSRRAFQRGQIDAMGCTLIELLLSRAESSRQAQAFYVVDFSTGADVLLAQTSIESVADLRGKRVGIELGNLTIYLLSRALQENGLGLDDVTLVPLDQLKMIDAFAQGQVDAVATFPPSSTAIASTGKANEIFDSGGIPREIVDLLTMDARMLRDRPRDAAAVARAFERAVQYAQDHPDDAYRFMAARENMSPADFAATVTDDIHIVRMSEQSRFLAPNGALHQTLARTDAILRKIGKLEGPDVAEGAIVDLGVDNASRGQGARH